MSTVSTDLDTLSLADLEAHDPRAPATSGTERRFLCPLPSCNHHTRGGAHRSLALNQASGAWKCHRCEASGKLVDFWEDRVERGPGMTRRARSRAALKRFTMLPSPQTGQPGEAPSGWNWRADLDKSDWIAGSPGDKYLAGRGIPAEIATAAGVRYSPRWGGRPAVLFPIHAVSAKEAAPVSVQGRYIDGKDCPKVRTGGPVSLGVFATPGAWKGPAVVITEAPIDALSLAVAGVPAIAICGKEVRPGVVDACALRRVWLAHDADDAGDKAAQEWEAELTRFGATARRLRPQEGYKDWNEALQCQGAGMLAAHLVSIMEAIPQPASPPALQEQHAPSQKPIDNYHRRVEDAILDRLCDGPASYVDLVRAGISVDAFEPHAREAVKRLQSAGVIGHNLVTGYVLGHELLPKPTKPLQMDLPQLER